MRVWFFLAVTSVAACGGDDLSPAVSREVFTRSNSLLHQLHTEAMQLPSWPTDDHAVSCSGGGRIVMRSELDPGGIPTQLSHAFERCMADGWTFDGDLDYFDISECADGSYSYRMIGDLDVAGHGACEIVANETCGVVSGIACGTRL